MPGELNGSRPRLECSHGQYHHYCDSCDRSDLLPRVGWLVSEKSNQAAFYLRHSGEAVSGRGFLGLRVSAHLHADRHPDQADIFFRSGRPGLSVAVRAASSRVCSDYSARRAVSIHMQAWEVENRGGAIDSGPA